MQQGEQYTAFHQQLLQLLHGEDFQPLCSDDKLNRLINFCAQELGLERAKVACVAEAVSLVNVHSDALLDRARLEFLTQHDDISGLPNQQAMRSHLEALLQAPPQGHAVFMLWIDIDRFKSVTDALGSEQTDQIIGTLASRLQTLADQPREMTARLSKDEFALILVHPSAHNAGAMQRIDGIRQALRRPLHIGGQRIMMTASIGISQYDTQEAAQLLQEAEASMLEAKTHGGNQSVIFTPALQRQRAQRLLLESELTKALDHRELVVHYQPIFAADGSLQSAEALVRWQHPERGLLQPGEFLPMALRAGLMVDVDYYVVEQVCRDLRSLRSRGLTCRVAINLCGQQLCDSRYPQQLQDLLSRYDVRGEDIGIEVTEEATTGDTFAVATNLQRLAEMGIQLSIDDFGTGYSSLARLKYLPFHKLKIDRSFIADLPNDQDVCSMVQAIMGLAEGLSLQLVSEGVENSAQRDWLAAHQCDFLQGFLMGEPMPLAEFHAVLTQQTEVLPAVAATNARR
ncbi:GGDEF domain-containing protein [Natronospirillum operosum]|uniref:GGDEF domain-containing protein n=1 Tax=Natronospirillum operosum TaxID=2759953 RepID=A0A4Z0WK05_9GAMM|nr:bifunctional diguanylate cyclase/phosphodiesterase [Natronospirillum operosum]TGG95515.1 GGDEF domain-containing protein [Natronospirillum operosum]